MKGIDDLKPGVSYGRTILAERLGYKSWNPLARGVLVPKKGNFLLFFATREGKASASRYSIRTSGDRAFVKGKFAPYVIRNLTAVPVERHIHFFIRDRATKSAFTYMGKANVVQPPGGFVVHGPESEFELKLTPPMSFDKAVETHSADTPAPSSPN